MLEIIFYIKNMRKPCFFMLLFSLSVSAKDLFEVPNILRHDVDFWSKVYREWDSHQVVIYDSLSKLVYSIVNLPRVEFGLSSASYPKTVEKEVALIKSAL